MLAIKTGWRKTNLKFELLQILLNWKCVIWPIDGDPDLISLDWIPAEHFFDSATFQVSELMLLPDRHGSCAGRPIDAVISLRADGLCLDASHLLTQSVTVRAGDISLVDWRSTKRAFRGLCWLLETRRHHFREFLQNDMRHCKGNVMFYLCKTRRSIGACEPVAVNSDFIISGNTHCHQFYESQGWASASAGDKPWLTVITFSESQCSHIFEPSFE
jgi:hypothetical protein